MNILIRTLLTLSVLCRAVIAIMAATTAPSGDHAQYVFGDTTYLVQATAQAVKGTETAPSPKEWSETFLVQAAGPRNNDELGQAGSKAMPWTLLRALPYPGSKESTKSYGPRGCAIVFERPLTRKWTNVFAISDLSVPGVTKADDRERLVVELTNGDTGTTVDDMVKAFNSSSGLPRLVCLPLDDKQGASLVDGLYFNADRLAWAAFHNISISVRPNVSDVKSSDEFAKSPTVPPIPLMAIASIRDYLGQPFPKADRILHVKQGRLIESLSVDAKQVRTNKPVRVRIALGTAALQMPEIVRLKASNGGFQRRDGDILYKSDESGEATIVLEIMCGGHGNGVFDFAERRELKVTVVE